MHEQASPARIQRRDGWTPERIRTFLYALRDGKNVTAAAAAAGMSRQSAYAFRASASGRPFAHAWHAAQELARKRRIDAILPELMAKRLRRLQRLAGPRYVVTLSRRAGNQDALYGQLWTREASPVPAAPAE